MPDPPIGCPKLLGKRGIDIKGDGGYVLAPGSRIATGPAGWRGRYTSDESPEPDLIRDLPLWLIDMLRPRPQRPASAMALNRPPSKPRTVALREAIEAVLTAPDGMQNDTLNTETFKLRRYIQWKRISAEEVLDAMTAAAEAGNHPASRAGPTIRSAMGRYYPKTNEPR